MAGKDHVSKHGEDRDADEDEGERVEEGFGQAQGPRLAHVAGDAVGTMGLAGGFDLLRREAFATRVEQVVGLADRRGCELAQDVALAVATGG